jgi:hypothetical protein
MTDQIILLGVPLTKSVLQHAKGSLPKKLSESFLSPKTDNISIASTALICNQKESVMSGGGSFKEV